jgi:hypothetical protein
MKYSVRLRMIRRGTERNPNNPSAVHSGTHPPAPHAAPMRRGGRRVRQLRGGRSYAEAVKGAVRVVWARRLCGGTSSGLRFTHWSVVT